MKTIKTLIVGLVFVALMSAKPALASLSGVGPDTVNTSIETPVAGYQQPDTGDLASPNIAKIPSVPETSPLIVGTLVLVPFVVSVLRNLRRGSASSLL